MKIAFVGSGGAARGLAHLGALRSLTDAQAHGVFGRDVSSIGAGGVN